MKRMILILKTVITADNYCPLTTIHKLNNEYRLVETGTDKVLSPLRLFSHTQDLPTFPFQVNLSQMS